MSYEQKYRKYKEKYLNLLKGGGDHFTATVVPIFDVNTPERFLVDIRIYGSIPPQLKNDHYDTSHNYVAFVSFSNSSEKCTISWNIKSKDDSDFRSDHDFKIKNKDQIINIAINAFKAAFPTYQPTKTWL